MTREDARERLARATSERMKLEMTWLSPHHRRVDAGIVVDPPGLEQRLRHQKLLDAAYAEEAAARAALEGGES